MGELERGRSAFQAKAWAAAFSELSAADKQSLLEPMDLVLLAQSAFMIGKDAEGGETLARAHQAFLAAGQVHLAARCGFWLGFSLLINGESAKGGGWLARVARLLEDQPDCVEKSYLSLPKAYRCFREGDTSAALAGFIEITEAGGRFGDKDLLTFGLQGQGRALIRQGEIERGVAFLDEAMVAVTAGEVSPINAGRVYCSVIEGCGEIFDLERAQEWSAELDRWCEAQPDMVAYRGYCLIHRTELLVLGGAWKEASAWAQKAVESLSQPTPRPDIGAAFYEQAEIHRMQGDFDAAEESYNQAARWNRGSGPGLARLRLAQGRTDAALAAIRRVAEEKIEPGRRALVLDAQVDIALQAGDLPCAREAAAELNSITARLDVPFLRALSARASGALMLAEGNPSGALTALRQSWNLWQDLRAPYEAARVQHCIGCTYLKLGDRESAAQELASAKATFEKLGAKFDSACVQSLLSAPRIEAQGGLTAREVEVLQLVASGMTNKEIAANLKISEKTVARHLSNIFTKLDLSSRSAATAYAYDHKLVSGDSRRANG